MSTTTNRTTGSRIGALAGLVFAFCFFVGVITLELPKNATDQELVAWWSDTGHQTAAILSMYLFVLAGLSFLVFLVKLRARLLAAEGGAGEQTALVFGAGVVFVSMLFVAAALRGVIAFAVKSPVSGESLPGADFLRFVPQIGYAVTGTGGLLAAALAMAATSWLIVKTGVFGRWLAWLGAVAAVVVAVAGAALSGVAAIPAVLVWTLATSVALWRPPRMLRLGAISARGATTAAVLASVLVVATLAVGCSGDEDGTASATTAEPSSVTTETEAEEPTALEDTWQTEPVTLDDMARTLREQGLGEYVDEFRAREAQYFNAPTTFILSIGDEWDLYRQPQRGKREPHDYNARYEVEGDAVTVTHSDGSNTHRWSVNGDTLSLTWLDGTFPPFKGVPDEVIQTALYMTADFERLQPGATPTASPGADGRIAFDSDRDGGDGDVWTIDPDGSDPLNLTADSDGDDFEAAWSPDGRRIVFVRDPDKDGPDDFELWLMRADGSGRRQLTDNAAFDQEAEFSPSGRWIAFVRDTDGDAGPDDAEIWVMRADGSGQRQLTDNELFDGEPAWSPDGRRIVFHRGADPSPDAGEVDVFDMRPDGSGVRRLTNAPGYDGSPDYSPDGKTIVFDSERDGDSDVWVMRRNGKHPRQLTGHDLAENAVDILATFSPDGRFIAFQSTRDSTDPHVFDLFLMRADGSGETVLTSSPGTDVGPDWQPLSQKTDDD
jgi:Tol biopolymer transport system component